MQEFTLSRKYVAPRGLWAQRREASLNWLALGLLLAAWNERHDNDASPTAARLRSPCEASGGYRRTGAPCARVTKASTYCKAG